jgi:hypothetical protein
MYPGKATLASCWQPAHIAILFVKLAEPPTPRGSRFLVLLGML